MMFFKCLKHITPKVCIQQHEFSFLHNNLCEKGNSWLNVCERMLDSRLCVNEAEYSSACDYYVMR